MIPDQHFLNKIKTFKGRPINIREEDSTYKNRRT